MYGTGPGGTWSFEGTSPGAGWHRHDWRLRRVLVLRGGRFEHRTVARRRWLLHGTTQTRLDRSPDEMGGVQVVLLVVLVKLWSWLSSDQGLQTYDEVVPALEAHGSRRTVQRWLHRLLPAAVQLQQALRTAVIEVSEPQPVERLFPGGLSPPAAVRRRRWKDLDATYSLATGLAFLFDGACALSTSATALLAEAQQGLDGTLGILRS